MKKTACFSIIALCLLFISGCGNDQYAIEKRYWKAQKEASKIFKNPDASPPIELDRVVNKLNDFIKLYPKTNLAVESEFTISRLYLVKKEYRFAREQLNSIIGKYSGTSQSIPAEALFLIGNSYESEDKWDAALVEYKKIMQRYPLTIRGIIIPLHIARHYKTKYQPEKMIQAYEEAVNHYKVLVEKYPKPEVGYRLYILMSQCYTAIKDWQRAVNTLNTVLERYEDKVRLDNVLMNLGLLYKNNLNDAAKAKQALERLVKDYPKSMFAKPARNLLQELEKK